MILAELHKNRFHDLKQLALPYIRLKYMKSILKTLGLMRYYEHTTHIISKLSGEPPPTINRETEETLLNLQEKLSKGRISHHTWDCLFSTSDPKKERNNEAWKFGRAWPTFLKAQNTQTKSLNNAYFFGPTGTGKSFLARCMLTRCIALRISVFECTGFTLSRNIFEGARERSNTMLRRACWSRALLIDDLDKGCWNKISLSTLWSVLDARSHHSKATIITSNLSKASLVSFFRERVEENTSLADGTLERLIPCSTFEFTGESIRKEQAYEDHDSD